MSAKVIQRGLDSDCAAGVCPSYCTHLMWKCDKCSCEGGWGGSQGTLEELAAEHVCSDGPAAAEARTVTDIEFIYVAGAAALGTRPTVARDEFNRWLAEVQRKAKEEAWDEGAGVVRDIYGDSMEENPYRSKEERNE